MRPWTNKSLGLGLFGLLLIVSGTALYFSSSAIFHHILQKELPLTPTSKAFEVWNDTTSLPPMYLKIHFFNWTNPEELLIKGKKPNLEEVGPYVFREIRQKADVVFHPENHTVSYLYRRWWYFVPELTNGTLNDSITQLNTVAISAKHKVRFWDGTFQTTLSFMLSTTKIHTTKTVDQLLFTGYDDSLIQLGKLAAMGEEIPPFDKFGWFYMRNGSTFFDGHFNMDTGASDISNFGVLRKWNHKDTTKFFKSPCNAIEGSAGEFWPPYRSKDEISLFSGDLCRPLTFDYAETTYHMGMEGYRYVLSEKTLGNNTRRRYPHDQAKYFEPTTTTEDFFDADHSAESTDSPDEDPDVVNIGNCFCNGRCTPAGLMNVSSCRYGAPVFVSLPHFNRADPILREQVVGVDPQEDHDFSITLEPMTGIPLQVSAKLQINILLEPSKTVSGSHSEFHRRLEKASVYSRHLHVHRVNYDPRWVSFDSHRGAIVSLKQTTRKQVDHRQDHQIGNDRFRGEIGTGISGQEQQQRRLPCEKRSQIVSDFDRMFQRRSKTVEAAESKVDTVRMWRWTRVGSVKTSVSAIEQ